MQLVVAAGQQQQQPPNLVLSGAPLQQDFGGGTTGNAGRMANHPIVVAGNTPPDPVQFGLVSALLVLMFPEPVELRQLPIGRLHAQEISYSALGT